MSAVVKLSTKMPGDPDTNGVDAQREHLVKEPDSIRVAVIWYDVQKVTIDTDTDEHIPTIRVRRIEPVGDIEDTPAGVREAVEKAVEERTGRTSLSFGSIDGDGHDPDQMQLEQ